MNPTVAYFDSDIGQYTELANSVQQQDTMVTVHFVIINCEKLKLSVIDQCFIWQKKFIQLLLRIAEEKINSIYKYVSENSKK